jgi:hypothetical protein
MAQAFGVVNILVSRKPSEYRLPQQPDKSMPSIPSGARIGKHITSQRAETEGVVKFAIGEQPGIGGDPQTMELKLQAAVEIEAQSAIIRFTRRVVHDGLIRSRLNY